jgi:hypothetical protein
MDPKSVVYAEDQTDLVAVTKIPVDL